MNFSLYLKVDFIVNILFLNYILYKGIALFCLKFWSSYNVKNELNLDFILMDIKSI